MFWLDGSSKLPFPIVSTRCIGKPCVKHLAEALASVENQAKIAKSWVKIGDFDCWCLAASELVDLTFSLLDADTSFLYYKDLISADQRLHYRSQISSHLMGLVSLLMFERARTQLKCAHARLLTNLKFTISPHHDDSVIQCSSLDSTETSARVTTLSPVLPRHTALN
jgi:hypothetical protein